MKINLMLNFTCAFVLPNVSALVPVHAVTMEIRCMYVCMYVRMYLCMYVCICMYVHVYTFSCIGGFGHV